MTALLLLRTTWQLTPQPNIMRIKVPRNSAAGSRMISLSIRSASSSTDSPRNVPKPGPSVRISGNELSGWDRRLLKVLSSQVSILLPDCKMNGYAPQPAKSPSAPSSGRMHEPSIRGGRRIFFRGVVGLFDVSKVPLRRIGLALGHGD